MRHALTGLMGLLLMACAPDPSAQLDTNKDVMRRFIAVVNASDWDGLDPLMTEDFHRHSMATTDLPEITSREQFKELQRSSAVAFPDQQVAVETMIAEGDLVAVLATYSGTNTGPMGPTAPTGRAVRVPFMGILRFEEGRIAEMWVEWDNLAMMTQLGLFPPPTASQ